MLRLLQEGMLQRIKHAVKGRAKGVRSCFQREVWPRTHVMRRWIVVWGEGGEGGVDDADGSGGGAALKRSISLSNFAACGGTWG